MPIKTLECAFVVEFEIQTPLTQPWEFRCPNAIESDGGICCQEDGLKNCPIYSENLYRENS